MILFYIFIIIAIIYGFLFVTHLTIFKFRFRFNEESIQMFFGLPGSGKTTVLADIIRQSNLNKKKKCSVYCNFPVRGANIVTREDIGKYEFRQPGDLNALILLDEGQTIYNCRNAMSKKESLRLQDDEIQFFCMHRHRKTMLCCFSQGFEDMDKIIRNRMDKLYYVEKSRIRPFIRIRAISKSVRIDDLQDQIIEGYCFKKWSTRYVYGRRVWKMFDTYDAPELPVIELKSWYSHDGA